MTPLRLVLDTNIVVSAAMKPDGLQRTVVLVATTKPARLYVTEPILAEYREVLARPNSTSVRGTIMYFWSAQTLARADYLVTGNPRHFPKFWKDTKVITARDFISIVAPHFVL